MRRLHSTVIQLAATLAASLILFAPLPASATEGLFWKVSGSAGTAYLLGSLHFGSEAIYPLDSEIQAAFAGSDRLAVEIDLQSIDPGAVVRWVSENGAYLDGTTLADHVSAETWRALKQRLTEYGMPVELVALQRPWMASLTLTTIALNHGGFRADLGIDRHFIQRAAGRTQIVALESFEEQMALLAELSAVEQEGVLAATLEDLDAGTALFGKLLDAWRRGDAAALDDHINASLRADALGDALFERLIEQRNRRMSLKIAALLEGGGTTFVVVGAGHLVGAGGVPRLLQTRGYRVEKR
jgi:uncharacterized protein YbaP (TraB family)